MKLSLRVRINLIYTIAISILLFIVIFLLQTKLEDYLIDRICNEMRIKILLLDQILTEKDLPENKTSPKQLHKKLSYIKKNILGCRITLVMLDGKVIADTEVKDVSIMDNHRYRREILLALKNTFGRSIRYSNTINMDMLYYAFFTGKYIIRISRPLSDVKRNLSAVNNIILLFFIILLILILVINFLLSGFITRPINIMTEFSKKYREGNLYDRMTVARSDEIGILQSTMNDMAENLDLQMKTIRQEKELIQKVVLTIAESLLVISTEGKIILTNKAFEKLFPGQDEYTGKFYFEAINSVRLNFLIEQALKTGEKYIEEFELVRMEELIVESYFLPIQGGKELLIILRDVTNTKKLQKIKSDFIENASHELKTPVSIITGYIETLTGKKDLEEKTKEDFIKRISKNIERLNHLILDISSLSEIEKGSHFFKRKRVDLYKIILRIINSLEARIKKQNLVCKILSEKKEVFVTGNENLLESIFYNLLTNSINYSKTGGHITFKIEEKTNAVVEIKVIDTGIGFPSKENKRIFERFYRIDKGRSREKGGTGLGLSIVKHAVLFHKGEITAESKGEGTGSVFTVCLPILKD